MAYTFEQPNKDVTKIILSAPRIFAATYDAGTPPTFNGQTILDVSAPPTGDVWFDVGVVDNASITVTKNWVHSELGVPQTRRKSAEIKRESKLDFTLKEFIIKSLALLHGTSAKNIMRLTTEATVAASPAPTRTVVSVGGGEGANFTAGDRICTASATGGLITSDNRATIESIATDALTLVGTGFPVAPTAGHKLQKYYSVEMTDPMGATNERSILLFFDWEEGSVKRQYVIWFPRMTVSDPFSPDLKGGKDFADAKCSLESLATTQTLTDGTSKSVHGIAYFFD